MLLFGCLVVGIFSCTNQLAGKKVLNETELVQILGQGFKKAPNPNGDLTLFWNQVPVEGEFDYFCEFIVTDEHNEIIIRDKIRNATVGWFDQTRLLVNEKKGIDKDGSNFNQYTLDVFSKKMQSIDVQGIKEF